MKPSKVSTPRKRRAPNDGKKESTLFLNRTLGWSKVSLPKGEFPCRENSNRPMEVGDYVQEAINTSDPAKHFGLIQRDLEEEVGVHSTVAKRSFNGYAITTKVLRTLGLPALFRLWGNQRGGLTALRQLRHDLDEAIRQKES